MRTVLLAALASLLATAAPGMAASATQEATRYRYDLLLALADAGTWPPERLQAVTLMLDEVTVDRGVMNWWIFIALSAASGPLTLRLEAGVGLAAPPDGDEADEPLSLSAAAMGERTLVRRRAAQDARAPVERATWVLADVQLP